MKLKKQYGCILLSLCTLCFGCSVKEEDPVVVSQTYPWALATDSPADTVTSLFAHRFAQEVEALSEGKMNINVYENGTLGGDRELIESCQGGDIPFVIQNTAPQANFMSELSIFDAPCVFTSIDELRMRVDDASFYQQIADVYEAYGFHLLGFGDQGFRVVTTNQAITQISDFKGQKIRTMENAYHLDFWKAIGANPTPMTFSEVYIGLQQGTIDAQENPYEVIVSGKLYEQQEYVVETNHLPHMLSLITNEDFFASLRDEEQAILMQAAENAKTYAREQADERIANRLDIITQSGTNKITLDEATRQAIIERCQPIYENIRKTCGDALYEAYMRGAKSE